MVFTDVGCTTSSYRIGVFAAAAQSVVPDALGNPDFIGQLTRLGMGLGRAGAGPNNASRCRKPAATRGLSAEKFAEQLATDKGVRVVVTDLQEQRELSEEEYSKLGGFEPRTLWLPKP